MNSEKEASEDGDMLTGEQNLIHGNCISRIRNLLTMSKDEWYETIQPLDKFSKSHT